MADESETPEHPPRRKLPPPDVARKPPPPSPPAYKDKDKAAPPPPSAPPLKVAVDAGSSEFDVDQKTGPDRDRPGADAGMPNRVIATFIDFVISAGICFGGILILADFFEWSAFLLASGYLVTRDTLPFLDGQSIGKKAMGICAVKPDGAPLTGDWQTGLIRNGALLIPFFPLVELFVLINRQEGPKPLLRLGDEWAKTKVINAGPVDKESKEEAASEEEEDGPAAS